AARYLNDHFRIIGAVMGPFIGLDDFLDEINRIGRQRRGLDGDRGHATPPLARRDAGIWWLNPLSAPYAVACQSTYVLARPDLVGVHEIGTNGKPSRDLGAGRGLLLRWTRWAGTARFLSRLGVLGLQASFQRCQPLRELLLLGPRLGGHGLDRPALLSADQIHTV